jgi:hypothetical protein
MRSTTRRLTPALMATGALILPASASATASAKEIRTATTAGVSYLRSQQQPNGSFAGFGGEWTLSALAAAKVAAANVKASETSTDARTFYRQLIGNTATWPGGTEPPVTDFENATLAAYAAGIDPARVSATQNLIAQIAARYRTANPGYYGELGLFNGTVFALLALADAKTRGGVQRVPQALLNQSVEVVRKNQHTDGGWTFLRAEGNKEALEAPAEAEMTGAAMAALCNAGIPASDGAVSAARSYLISQLKAEPLGSGGFQAEFGPNTDTNAWAVQGLNACGVPAQAAEFTTSKGKTAIDFEISHQLAGGGFFYQSSAEGANLYSSQDAVRSLAGAGFTATPPTPKQGLPRWVYEREFTKGAASMLALVIDSGTSPLRVCEVSITAEAPTTNLAKVLEAAEKAATPAGCVSSFTPATGAGAITSIDGQPSPAEAKWNVRIDGGSEQPAKRATTVRIGDTIYLRLA